MMNARIINALSEIYDIERLRLATVDYLATHDIDINAVAGACGSPTVTPITLLPNRRFCLDDGHGADAVDGVVIEAIGADGETSLDLVGWPLDNPRDVRTLLGRAPLVGMEAAFNPATYYLGHSLIVHCSPLTWLQASCQGAAVAVSELAGRTFLDIADMGGQIGADNHVHARQLKAHLRAMINRVEIVSLDPIRRAA